MKDRTLTLNSKKGRCIMNRIIVIIIVGFVFLGLLGLSERASAQRIYRWPSAPVYYPPVYYPPPGYCPLGYYVPPYVIWSSGPFIGGIPFGTGLAVGPGFPGRWGYVPPPPPVYVREGPDEKKGEGTIRSSLSSKDISFRMNRPLIFSTDRGTFYLKPDFQLRNGVIIEYWSQGDEQDSKSKKEDFERYKETVRAGLTLIKPYFLLDKKDRYEECKKTGRIVYFIDPIELKDPNEAVSIEVSIKQELDKILKETR